jgi:hypothetical protein
MPFESYAACCGRDIIFHGPCEPNLRASMSFLTGIVEVK